MPEIVSEIVPKVAPKIVQKIVPKIQYCKNRTKNSAVKVSKIHCYAKQSRKENKEENPV